MILNKLPYVKTYLDDGSFAKLKKSTSHAGASWVIAGYKSFAVRPLNGLFSQTGHPAPGGTKIVGDSNLSIGQHIYNISFVPPESVIQSWKIEL